MSESPAGWIRRTVSRPFLCHNCDEQCWVGDDVYLMLDGSDALYCMDCPPDDVEDDGSIRVWFR